MLIAEKQTEIQAVKWRMLFHSIDTQSKDGRLNDGIDEFLAWRACITREALNHRQWVKLFYMAAVKMQKQSEDQAAAFAAEAFHNWL